MNGPWKSELLKRFAEVHFIDTEFRAPDGERQTPVCLVEHGLRSGRTTRHWLYGLHRPCPFEVNRDHLFVAYYAIAEVSTLIELGWPVPTNILDLFTEFRCLTNGVRLEHGNGLLSALDCHGLPSMSAAEKEAGRKLVMEHTSYTEDQRRRIETYCEGDVMSLVRLLEAMWPMLDLDDALLRGDYMRALAFVEWESVPLDQPLYRRLSRHWSALKRSLIDVIDPDYQVYVGTKFVTQLFEVYLSRPNRKWDRTAGILWPRLPSGAPALDKVTFRDMANVYPELNALHELRNTLAKTRLSDLHIGSDGRNRCGLSAFRTVTGRNAPRASRFIFGPSRWLRGLIRPEPGTGVAYLDYKSQEIGTGAALADDGAMMDDYATGDPYAAFARRSGLMPPGGTEDTHPDIRERCKSLELGLNYGMTVHGLARRLDTSEVEAADLSDRHQHAYHRFWSYAERVVHTGMQGVDLCSVFGWRRRLAPETRPRSLRNWPVQSASAAMLQLAIVAGIEAGIRIITSVHDAVMILSPLHRLQEDAEHMARLMVRASEVVTGGFPLRVDISFVRWPERFMDKRGAEMWTRALLALCQIEGGGAVPDGDLIDPDSEDADPEIEGLGEFAGKWK